MPEKLSIKLEQLRHYLNGFDIVLNENLIKEARYLEDQVAKLQKEVAALKK